MLGELADLAMVLTRTAADLATAHLDDLQDGPVCTSNPVLAFTACRERSASSSPSKPASPPPPRNGPARVPSTSPANSSPKPSATAPKPIPYPFAGSRVLRDLLRAEGVVIGRVAVATLMRKMGIEALHRWPNKSTPAPDHKI